MNPAFAQTDTSTTTKPADSQATTTKPKLAKPRARGLSWSIKTGRIPASGGIVHGTMGFSGLPRIAYHHTFESDLSLGAMVGFDVGHDHPKDAFDGALLVGVPIRYRKAIGSLDLGIGGVVGVRLPGQNDHDLSILVEPEINLGFAVHHRFLVGGGVTAPLWIGLGKGSRMDTDFINFDNAILIGPFIEFHVTPPLALTFEAKAGPYFTTEGREQTDLGLRTTLGIAYRL